MRNNCANCSCQHKPAFSSDCTCKCLIAPASPECICLHLHRYWITFKPTLESTKCNGPLNTNRLTVRSSRSQCGGAQRTLLPRIASCCYGNKCQNKIFAFSRQCLLTPDTQHPTSFACLESATDQQITCHKKTKLPDGRTTSQ